MALRIRGIANLSYAAGINRQRLYVLDIYDNLCNGFCFYLESGARNQRKNTGTDTGDVEKEIVKVKNERKEVRVCLR